MQGTAPIVNFTGGATAAYVGFNKKANLLGTDDWLDRPYHVQTFWIDQDIGNLHLDLSYDRQRDTQLRNDSSFGNNGFGTDGGAVVSVDSNGRPYEDETTGNPKLFHQLSTTFRVSAAYSFNTINPTERPKRSWPRRCDRIRPAKCFLVGTNQPFGPRSNFP